VAVVGLGTLLHGMTQVVSAMLLPAGAPTGRAATMTLRGAAASFGSGAGAALGGVLLHEVGFPIVGAMAFGLCVVAATIAWWGRATVTHPSPRAARSGATA
jgi:predicted MFS family arabinose efflux permease